MSIFESLLDILRKAWGQPYMPHLTIAFFIAASMATAVKRRLQAEKMGDIAPGTQKLPGYADIPMWLDTILVIVIAVMNFRYALMVYASGFILACVGVLEFVGALMWLPFTMTTAKLEDREDSKRIDAEVEAELSGNFLEIYGELHSYYTDQRYLLRPMSKMPCDKGRLIAAYMQALKRFGEHYPNQNEWSQDAKKFYNSLMSTFPSIAFCVDINEDLIDEWTRYLNSFSLESLGSNGHSPEERRGAMSWMKIFGMASFPAMTLMIPEIESDVEDVITMISQNFGEEDGTIFKTNMLKAIEESKLLIAMWDKAVKF